MLCNCEETGDKKDHCANARKCMEKLQDSNVFAFSLAIYHSLTNVEKVWDEYQTTRVIRPVSFAFKPYEIVSKKYCYQNVDFCDIYTKIKFFS